MTLTFSKICLGICRKFKHLLWRYLHIRFHYMSHLYQNYCKGVFYLSSRKSVLFNSKRVTYFTGKIFIVSWNILGGFYIVIEYFFHCSNSFYRILNLIPPVMKNIFPPVQCFCRITLLLSRLSYIFSYF